MGGRQSFWEEETECTGQGKETRVAMKQYVGPLEPRGTGRALPVGAGPTLHPLYGCACFTGEETDSERSGTLQGCTAEAAPGLMAADNSRAS
jgi:hypothetical protein